MNGGEPGGVAVPRRAIATAKVGDSVSRDYTFTVENIARYAEISGDTNRLHLDADFAAESRFGTIIASAAHSTGVLISVLADAFAPNGEAVGLGFDLTLRRAVKAGTQTRLVWTITERGWSEKLKGEVVVLTGEVREAESGAVLVKANGRMLVLAA